MGAKFQYEKTVRKWLHAKQPNCLIENGAIKRDLLSLPFQEETQDIQSAEILNGPLHFLQDPLFNMGRLGFVGERGGD